MRILVWDWPVRVFHWALVATFAGAWLASGDDRYTHAHAFCGYAATLLVLFRVAWGFAGTRHARFASFFASPRRALAYVRDLQHQRATRYLTHNPIGSWAVWLLLGLVLVLAITGVFTLGGAERQGPLAGVLDREAGHLLGELHEWIAWAGLALIATHVAGVVMEGRVHHENLVRAMLDGRKDGDAADAIAGARPRVAVGLLLALAVFGGWYFRGYLAATPGHPYLPYTSAPLAGDPRWTEECGSCHLAFHPSLLPARSWTAMLASQQDHFGEDLALDAATAAALHEFARRHAAEATDSKAAAGITRSVPAGAAPLRITETRYWRHQHHAIDDRAWKAPKVHGKPDCAACHADAEAATFEDGAMRLPQ